MQMKRSWLIRNQTGKTVGAASLFAGHLEHVEGRDGGVAHLEDPAQVGVVLAEAVVPSDRQESLHGVLEPTPRKPWSSISSEP
eukprot:scaffold446907_cov19-Prasinocladus_malaysianus.AAC.1